MKQKQKKIKTAQQQQQSINIKIGDLKPKKKRVSRRRPKLPIQPIPQLPLVLRTYLNPYRDIPQLGFQNITPQVVQPVTPQPVQPQPQVPQTILSVTTQPTTTPVKTTTKQEPPSTVKKTEPIVKRDITPQQMWNPILAQIQQNPEVLKTLLPIDQEIFLWYGKGKSPFDAQGELAEDFKKYFKTQNERDTDDKVRRFLDTYYYGQTRRMRPEGLPEQPKTTQRTVSSMTPTQPTEEQKTAMKLSPIRAARKEAFEGLSQEQLDEISPEQYFNRMIGLPLEQRVLRQQGGRSTTPTRMHGTTRRRVSESGVISYPMAQPFPFIEAPTSQTLAQEDRPQLTGFPRVINPEGGRPLFM